MKKFSRFLTVLLAVLAVAALFALTSSAAEEKVIFIKDGGKGDGSSPDKPLAVTSADYFGDNASSLYVGFRSPLYQAANALVHSGGTIVLVGEVKLDVTMCVGTDNKTREFHMPSHPTATIKLTSVYNGVDYRETANARLVLQTPANFYSGGPLVFDDINICTMPSATGDGSDRLIEGSAFDLTIGEGVECTPLDASGKAISSPAKNLYPSICGASRFHNVTRENPYVTTVNGGTFNTLDGNDYGINIVGYGRVEALSTLNIGGKAHILSDIYATSHHEKTQTVGDINMNISGGIIDGSICLVGAGGFGSPNCNASLSITGGTVNAMLLSGAPTTLTSDGNKRYQPKTTTVDLSGLDAEIALKLAKKCQRFTYVILPAADLVSATVKSQPTKTEYLAGDYFDPTGLVISTATETKNFNMPYTKGNKDFVFTPALNEKLTAGTTSVALSYGSIDLGQIEITVTEAPEVKMEGAMIRVRDERQGLRFVARAETPSSQFEIVSYGIVVTPTEYCTVISKNLPGAKVIDRTGSKFSDNGSSFTFDGAVSGIPMEEYTIPFTAFAYITYKFNGSEYTVYSEPIERSVESVARKIVSNGSESTQVRNLIRVNVVEAIDNDVPSTVNQTMIDARIAQLNANMQEMANVKWKCGVNLDFAKDSEFTSGLQYQKGAVYTGIPYIAGENGNASLQQWLDLYPDGSTYDGATGWDTMLGNQCSSSITRALQSISNAHAYPDSYSIAWAVPRGGESEFYTAVGDYEIPGYAVLTDQIVQANGSSMADRAQAIFRGFAEAKDGDFLVSTWLSGKGSALGHIRIINSTSVTQLGSGKINGSRSYLETTEQMSTMDKTKKTTWRIRLKYTYDNLVSASSGSARYIPIRLSSFSTGYFATPYIGVKDFNTPENIADGLTGVLHSNYDISAIKVKITDSTGKEVLAFAQYPFAFNTFDTRVFDPDDQVGKLAKGNYHYELSATYADRTETLVAFDFTK